MKKIGIISFTGAGALTAERLLSVFKETYECRAYIKKKFWGKIKLCQEIKDWEEDGASWTRKRFEDYDGIIYVGAVGIAVRLIAPCVCDKMEDPAVVVVDEKGKFAISLLSGHVGGANRLAKEVAKVLEGIPVITTATDLNRKFAVDVFAKENDLVITDRLLAKEISSRILEGKAVTLSSDFPIEGKFPSEVRLVSSQEAVKPDIYITIKTDKAEKKESLVLIPRCVVLGMGCRKNAGEDIIWETMEEVCREAAIDKRSIFRIASIDKKKEEPGLIKAAERLRAEFVTFSSEQLESVPGSFRESEFVRKTVGVGNVCERAAVLGAGAGFEAELSENNSLLIGKKFKGQGVTAAIAVRKQDIRAGRT